MQNQQEYWNSVADQKEFTTVFQIELFEKWVPQSAQILDAGCGYGRTLEQLHERNFQNLHGIDFSCKMIERGRKLFPHLDLRVSQGSSIPFPDAAFDAVSLIAVLTCIASDDAQTALLSEVRRVLRPEGILYINDFLLNNDERNRTRYAEAAEKFQGAFPYGVFELPEGALLRHYERKTVEERLQNFQTKCFEEVTFRTMNGHTSCGFYFFGTLK